MKNPHRRLIVIATSLTLMSGFILVNIAENRFQNRRKAERIATVNLLVSASSPISTNALPNRQSQTP